MVTECIKMKIARAKRAKLLFFVVKYANMSPLLSWLLSQLLPNNGVKIVNKSNTCFKTS